MCKRHDVYCSMRRGIHCRCICQPVSVDKNNDVLTLWLSFDRKQKCYQNICVYVIKYANGQKTNAFIISSM